MKMVWETAEELDKKICRNFSRHQPLLSASRLYPWKVKQQFSTCPCERTLSAGLISTVIKIRRSLASVAESHNYIDTSIVDKHCSSHPSRGGSTIICTAHSCIQIIAVSSRWKHRFSTSNSFKARRRCSWLGALPAPAHGVEGRAPLPYGVGQGYTWHTGSGGCAEGRPQRCPDRGCYLHEHPGRRPGSLAGRSPRDMTSSSAPSICRPLSSMVTVRLSSL